MKSAPPGLITSVTKTFIHPSIAVFGLSRLRRLVTAPHSHHTTDSIGNEKRLAAVLQII